MIDLRPKKIPKNTGIKCADCGFPYACAWWQGIELCTTCMRSRQKHSINGIPSKPASCPKGWRKSMGVKYDEYEE